LRERIKREIVEKGVREGECVCARERERERGISEWLVRKIEEICARTRNKVKVGEKEGECKVQEKYLRGVLRVDKETPGYKVREECID
jgi:hypothetical protein